MEKTVVFYAESLLGEIPLTGEMHERMLTHFKAEKSLFGMPRPALGFCGHVRWEALLTKENGVVAVVLNNVSRATLYMVCQELRGFNIPLYQIRGQQLFQLDDVRLVGGDKRVL